MFQPNRDKSYRCTDCKSQYNKQHYELNKAAYVARAAARKSQVVRVLYERIYEYLDAHPCVDCGEDDVVVLEFDHIAEKNYEVTRMVSNGFSWRSIMEEIAKCEVRCANCHCRVTAKRARWSRYRPR
jgi:hypothetical protein